VSDSTARPSGGDGDARPDADNAEARNGYARPDGVTLLDKARFYCWACERHQLEAADMNVLRVIVFELLGLQGGKPHTRRLAAPLQPRAAPPGLPKPGTSALGDGRAVRQTRRLRGHLTRAERSTSSSMVC
jgi:hypothetical protein